VLLRKGRGKEKVAKHPRFSWLHIDCPEEEATYIITKGGIDDPGNGKDK